jgi:hypothetical protein
MQWSEETPFSAEFLVVWWHRLNVRWHLLQCKLTRWVPRLMRAWTKRLRRGGGAAATDEKGGLSSG